MTFDAQTETIEVSGHTYEVRPIVIGGEILPDNFIIEVPSDEIDHVVALYHADGAKVIYAHVHTHYSRVEQVVHGVTRIMYNMFCANNLTIVDSLMTPSQIVAHLAERSVTHIIPADHDTMDAISLYRDAALGQVIVIPGIEFTTGFGHLLVIGGDLTEYEIADLSEIFCGLRPNCEGDRKRFMEIYQQLVERGFIVQAAHPYDFRDSWRGPAIPGEIHNANVGKQLAGTTDTRFIPSITGQRSSLSGSDAHQYDQLQSGGNFTVVLGATPGGDIVEDIRNGRVQLVHIVERSKRWQLVPPVIWRIPRMLNEQARANDMSFPFLLRTILFPEIKLSSKGFSQIALAVTCVFAISHILLSDRYQRK